MAMRRLAVDVFRYAAMLQGWLCMALGSLLAGVLLIPPALLLAPVWPRSRDVFADATRALLRLYVRSLLFVRLRVEGAEKRARGPRVVVANHQSWLDPIVLIALEPRLGGPVRRYMLRVPLLGAIIRLLGFFPADIGELASLEALRRSAEAARARGGGMLFFPEGSRSKTGAVGRFHRGAFRAAVDHALPIQPVVIEGLDRALPPGRVVPPPPGRHLVRVRYLDPIAPPFGDGLRRDVVRALGERARARIVDELDRMRAERATSG